LVVDAGVALQHSYSTVAVDLKIDNLIRHFLMGMRPKASLRTTRFINMTMRWVAQASASAVTSHSLVTDAWSCPAILFRAAFYFSKRGTFFSRLFFTFSESEHA